MEFNLTDALNNFTSNRASLVGGEVTPAESSEILSNVVQSLATSVESVQDNETFQSIQELLHIYPTLPRKVAKTLADFIISSVSTETELISQLQEEEEGSQLPHHRNVLEILGFLIYWLMVAVDEDSAARRKAESKSGSNGGASRATDPSNEILRESMDSMIAVFRLPLSKIFVTTSERDTFVGMFTKAVYQLMESEIRMKSVNLKKYMFKVICMAIKYHGHAFGAQICILQNLFYYDHLAEPMAELLDILSEQYDYPQLTDDILRELSNRDYSGNDNQAARLASAFIVRMSELAPRLMLKQMTFVIDQLNCNAYSLRCGVVEVLGNLIAYLSKQEDDEADSRQKKIDSFFDVLEERYLDINPYVRSKNLQIISKLCDLEQKFPKHRTIITGFTVRSLEDKSSNVRRSAIKLLVKLVHTHPFGVLHGSQLSKVEWSGRLARVEAELAILDPKPQESSEDEDKATSELEEKLVDVSIREDNSDEEGEKENDEEKSTGKQDNEDDNLTEEQIQNLEAIEKLKLTKRYYMEALTFIDLIGKALENTCLLLSSKNKNEVIDAMDFFVTADAFDIEEARVGIRKMLHLIWVTGNSEDGKGIQSHVIECYRQLYLSYPDDVSRDEAVTLVTRNLISLSYEATVAELTSLERLLCIAYKDGLIINGVVSRLWDVYGYQKKDISRKQRRGAIIVLGMLALADHDIVLQEVDTILRIGLGQLGYRDLSLCRYSCLALQRITQNVSLKKGIVPPPSPRISQDNQIVQQLVAILETNTENTEWFSVAEQALNAVYLLVDRPDVLCSHILKRKAISVLSMPAKKEEPDSGEEKGQPESSEEKSKKTTACLSQLFFLLGHIAIKQIVYLESQETEFKRKKAVMADNDKRNSSKGEEEQVQDDFQMIAGTSEDDFTDMMMYIRENELLFGKNALLGRLAPLAYEVCSHPLDYPDKTLQAAATLCVCKLMCVSSLYCQKCLPLILRIMERSDDPVARSNTVLALGDMTVCFNNLIEPHTDHLYRRLRDYSPTVQRTCLMTLTFLILAGQVKVKGQLGEMAKCLEDPDQGIVDMTRMFFTELSTKENSVYNAFIDIYSVLSTDSSLPEEGFQRIMKFLSGFIEKEKHARQLADKLAARLPKCENERQWNNICFTIGLLPHKNEELTKLVGEQQFKKVAAR